MKFVKDWIGRCVIFSLRGDPPDPGPASLKRLGRMLPCPWYIKENCTTEQGRWVTYFIPGPDGEMALWLFHSWRFLFVTCVSYFCQSQTAVHNRNAHNLKCPPNYNWSAARIQKYGPDVEGLPSCSTVCKWCDGEINRTLFYPILRCILRLQVSIWVNMTKCICDVV